MASLDDLSPRDCELLRAALLHRRTFMRLTLERAQEGQENAHKCGRLHEHVQRSRHITAIHNTIARVERLLSRVPQVEPEEARADQWLADDPATQPDIEPARAAGEGE